MDSAIQHGIQFVGSQITSERSYESNVAKLKSEVERLEADKDDMQSKVRDAERKGEVMTARVKNWLGRVDEIIARSKGLIPIEEGHQEVIAGSNNQTNEGRPAGTSWLKLPFAKAATSRHRLIQSKEAEEMAQKVREIIDEGRSFQITDISLPASPQMITSSFARGYKALGSRTTLLDNIKKALQDPNIYLVGVYGMGGVGKTTLVEELAFQVKQERSFDVVVTVTIAGTTNPRIIQEHLAERLGLKFKHDTDEVRAGELRARITKEKSILVILDNVWDDKLDLTRLGVPYGDDYKVCKLVLTSRDSNVLIKGMGTQIYFSLDALSDEESWDLFQKTVGDDVLKCHGIEPIAREVAECCAGLPLSIVIVAKSLKGEKDVRGWKDSLSNLKKKRGDGIDQVIGILRFSYDRLKSEELKSLFLLIGSVAQHGTGLYNDDEFFSICWGLGIYENVNTLAQARNRHYRLIKDLRSSSLLLEGGTDRGLWKRDHISDMDRLQVASAKRPTLEVLSMHDRVRDMARSVASDKHPTFTVLAKLTGVNEWPKEDQLQNYHRIILPRYAIGELPEKLDCPELELLLLHHEGSLSWYLPVLDNFFSGMRKVKVIQFHLVSLKSPSPSLCLLGNLLSLTLYKSELEDITILGQLTSLEILIIEACSDIKELPKELAHLTRLRMLSLNRSDLELPKNILSSFTCLEELYMVDCSIKWESEGCASLGELRNCCLLSTVELTVHNGSELPRDLHNFANLEKYKISMAYPSYKSHYKSYDRVWQNSSRALNIDSRDRIDYTFWSDGWAKKLLTRADNLQLSKLEDVKNIIPELIGVDSMELRYLSFEESTRLLHIVYSNIVRGLHHAFPNLEALNLHKLVNMEEICHGPLPEQSFDKLEAITVTKCHKLKNLFLRSHVTHLKQLLWMNISKCGSMKEIIAKEEEIDDETENNHLVFPELWSLKLANLPELLSFCSAHLADDTGLAPPTLFYEKVKMPKLERMKLCEIHACYKIWANNISHSCMENLTRLEVFNCQNLTSLFPSTVARGGLVKLQYLKISECEKLEEIFVQEDTSCGEVTLPSLETLKIFNLKNLKPSWHAQLTPNSWCKLYNMKIDKCPKLLNVFPPNVLNHLQNLGRLYVKECSELEGIFEIQDLQDPNSLCKLHIVEIDGCPKLLNVFPWNVLTNLQNLQILYVKKCSELEGIFEVQDQQVLNFLCKLNEMKIHGCPRLLNVMTPVMAANLPELRVLKISNCGSMKEIVANENDEDASKEINFMKLEELELTKLARLTSFCSGQYSFKFPSLKKVRVFNCPEMKTFCNGNLTTPILKKVTKMVTISYEYEYEDEDEDPEDGDGDGDGDEDPELEEVHCWNGDLNTTIANIFEEVRAEQGKRNKRQRIM